jgi:hypothetical protein
MRYRVSGEQVSAEFIDTLAALTDRARLRHAEVAYDPTAGTVSLPITRYPLIKRRRVLPNIHDLENPIPAVVAVRNVVSCTIENNTPSDLDADVQLIFGLQIRDNQVFVCSAEEDRGQPCFSATLEVSGLDIELADNSEAEQVNDG